MKKRFKPIPSDRVPSPVKKEARDDWWSGSGGWVRIVQKDIDSGVEFEFAGKQKRLGPNRFFVPHWYVADGL